MTTAKDKSDGFVGVETVIMLKSDGVSVRGTYTGWKEFTGQPPYHVSVVLDGRRTENDFHSFRGALNWVVALIGNI